MLAPKRGVIHVSVPVAGGRSRRPGICIHRRPGLTGRETTQRDGIPLTRPARTLADLRSTAGEEAVRTAARQAEVLNLPLGAFVWGRTGSELEHRFLRLCRRARLPEPEVNVRVGPYLVDFVWRAQRLIVETDGYRYHRGSIAFEEDRARDNHLVELGYEVRRFTHTMLTKEPAKVIALVGRRLAERG